MKKRTTIAKRFLAFTLTLAMAVTLTPVAGLAMYGEAAPQEVYAEEANANVSYDTEYGNLTWDPVDGASAYYLRIKDENGEMVSGTNFMPDNTSSNVLERLGAVDYYPEDIYTFTLEVTLSSGETQVLYESEAYKYHPVITGISLAEDGALTWARDTNSDTRYYYVYANGTRIADYYFTHWDPSPNYYQEQPDPCINIYKLIDAKIFAGALEKSETGTYQIRIESIGYHGGIVKRGRIDIAYDTNAELVEIGEMAPSFDAESQMLSWAPYENYEDPYGNGLLYKYAISTPGVGEHMNQGTDQTSASVSSLFWYLEHNFLAKDGDPEVLTVEAILCTDPSDSENTTYTVAEGSVDVTYQSLSAPLRLTVDEENQRLTWEACTEDSFDHYVWLIRPFDETSDIMSLGTDTSLSFAAIQARLDQRHEDYGLPEMETYDVYVFALDANDEWIAKGIYPYYYEQELEKEFGEVTVDGTTLRWDDVEGASGYRVIVPGNDRIIEDANTADVGPLLDEAYTNGALEGYESPYSVVLEAGYDDDDNMWVPIARWKGEVAYTPTFIHDHVWVFTGFTFKDDTSGESIQHSATADYECSSCSEKASITASGRTNGIGPTCTEGSSIEYTAWISAQNSLDGKLHQDVKVFEYEAKGHDLIYMPAKDPTEDEKGNIECWKCKECWTYFLDEEGKQEISEEEAILPQVKKDLSKSEVSLEGMDPGEVPVFPYDGESHRPGWKITYNGKSVASVYFTREIRDAQDNVVTDPVNAGTYWMVFTAKGTSYTGEKRAAFTIEKAPIESMSFPTFTAKTYSGKALTPTFTGHFGDASYPSKDNDAFTAEYEDNTDAGEATIIVTAKEDSNFTGETELHFTINPKKITPTVTTSYTSTTWSGSNRSPSITVKNDGTKLVKNEDYVVSMASSRKNVGKYTITIKPAEDGNYTFDNVKKSFKINPKGTSLSSLSAQSKAFKVTWKKQSAKMSSSVITGYQIQWSTSSSFSKDNHTKKVSGYSKTSHTINSKAWSGIKGGKKYYVRIRTYKTTSSGTYYSSWSDKKSVTTKK